MKYYQISRTSDPKIIGIKTGTSQVERLEDSVLKNDQYLEFKNQFSGYNIDFWEKQDIVFRLNPPLIMGRMRQGAKKTDIMEYGSVFHFLHRLYSEKYINIIKTFNIGNYKTFDFKIEAIEKIYYLLFIQAITLDEIYYNESTVITGHKVMNNVKYHEIKNPQEYLEFNSKYPTGRFELLTISKKHYGKDIIQTEVDTSPFYSERLIDFLLDCGITGLQVAYKNSIALEFI